MEQKIVSYFKRVLFVFFTLFIKPHSVDEDDQRSEFILNILLVSFILLFLFLTAEVVIFSVAQGGFYRGVELGMILIPLTVLISLLILSRLRLSRFVALIFVWLLYALVVFALWNWGLGLPQAWLFFALVISFAAQLIGTGYSFVVTLSVCAAFLFILFSESAGVSKPDLSWLDRPFMISDVLAASATFFVFTIVSWLSNREITRSLIRARTSERLLKEERDNLEIKVEERTRDLVKEQEARLQEIERFAEFGQLASGIMHDLANPLTAISLNLDFAKEDPHIKEAISATHRMESLLKTARKQFIRTDDVSEFSIADEIEQTVLLLSQKCKKVGVRIDIEMVENVRVLGLPIKFFRVMMNILSNAIDAYEDAVMDPAKKIIRVSCVGDGRRALIKVTDFGVGIPQAYLEKIFLPFFSTKTGKGSGFGLAMAKQIVEGDFRGAISVVSQPSQGTTFTIELPL